MRADHPDEYQDSVSAGSLARARSCWHELLDADGLQLPHQFVFVFHCPTPRLAAALTDFLRLTHFGGVVTSTDRVGVPDGAQWHVAGTTHATVWSLSSLEHLFMRLRRAGTRHDSALATLHLLPLTRGRP